MTTYIFAVTALSVLCAVGFLVLAARAARLRRHVHDLQEALSVVTERLAGLEEHPVAAPPEPKVFKASLDEARIKARLEVTGGGQAPEKYRYVASMAARGMSPAEIAEVLKISPREADQLVRLAQVARKGMGGDSL
ncbi:MAG TPA: hypothetical protein VJ955_00945 [Desulfuromonadales bacterium]|nr:hypothetical protein [Desulfuromonadales bacterium]